MEIKLNKRPIKDISHDLAEIDDAIRVTQEIMINYPEEPAIELGLNSLEYKKQLLFDELQKSDDISRQRAFDIVFNGDSILDSRMSLDCLGDTLSSFQNVIKSIVTNEIDKTNSPKKIKRNEIEKISQFNILAFSTGSFRIILAPSTLSDNEKNIDNLPSIDALEKFNQLINCKDNPDEFKKIKYEVGVQSLEKYGDFISNLKKYRLDIKFYDQIKTSYIQKKEITRESAKRIFKTINNNEVIKKTETFSGKLKAVDTIDRKFTFLAHGDLKIKGKYDKQLDDLLSNPDFNEEISATFDHKIISNDIINKYNETWMLLALSRSI